MKRYIFLLLAFFLSFNAQADGLGMSNSMMNINSAPSGLSPEEATAIKDRQKHQSRTVANTSKSIKETSPRNVNELGNIKESTERAQQPSSAIPLGSQTAGTSNIGLRKNKTALSNVSCKTYEGKIYGQGEAGYNDCIRTIKTDRQKTTTVP